MDHAPSTAEAGKVEETITSRAQAESFTTGNGTNGPAIATGPSPASSPKQSIDELAAELKRHPFFATSAEDIGDDNPELEALRALAYEGTRFEIADNFRNQGNEATRSRDWGNAKEFYTRALAALKAPRRPDEVQELQKESKEQEGEGGAPAWEKHEAVKERDLRGKVLANRALCQLNLKNYRSCTLDCVAALEVEPGNVKAHYRLAQALLALGKLEEAAKACKVGLGVEAENGALLKTKEVVASAIRVRNERERQRQEKEARKARQEQILKVALAAREIRTRNTANPPDLEDARMTLVPDPLSPSSSLVVPVLVLYPLHAQTDFVKQFGEEQTLAEHLEYLLPVPWEEKGEYGGGKADKVEMYVETREGGLVKWGKKIELLRLLSGTKVDVVDGVVTVNVVPKARAQEWIGEFKRRKGKAGSQQ